MGILYGYHNFDIFVLYALDAKTKVAISMSIITPGNVFFSFMITFLNTEMDGKMTLMSVIFMCTLV